MKRQANALSRSYKLLCANVKYDPAEIPMLVRHALHARGVFLEGRKKLSIVWVGTNWEQDNSGFLQALNRFGDVFNFQNSQGVYGLEYGVDAYDQDIAERNGQCLLKQIADVETTYGRVDLLIGQMLQNYVPVKYLQVVQGRGIATVNIAMDDRLPELWEEVGDQLQGAVGLVAGVDLTLTTSPECCERYAYHGGHALFWPLASDPDLFKPAVEKDIGISFVGNNYGARGAIIRTFQSAGIPIQAYGRGWPNGSVTASEAAGIFGRSVMILGVGTVGYCEDMVTLKLRDFDATMAGALYITHHNPDLLMLFRDEIEIVTYKTIEEAVRKVRYYLANRKLAHDIGQNAAVKSRSLHTWDFRIASALSVLGFSPEGE